MKKKTKQNNERKETTKNRRFGSMTALQHSLFSRHANVSKLMPTMKFDASFEYKAMPILTLKCTY